MSARRRRGQRAAAAPALWRKHARFCPTSFASQPPRRDAGRYRRARSRVARRSARAKLSRSYRQNYRSVPSGWNGRCRAAHRCGLAVGNIGSEIAYKASPDGYTLLSAPPPPLVNNQNLYPHLAFDPAKFEPISIMAEAPSGLFVNPDKIKAKTVPELIAYMKANPGKVLVATQGNGTTAHLTAEMFNLMAGVKTQMVPYRGSAPALQGLLAGNVDIMFDNLGVSLPMAKAGKLKLLGVATAHRLPSMPDVPTVAETLPGFLSSAWYAVVAPPKTPKAIVDKINADINEALKDSAVIDKLKKLSCDVVGGSPQQAADFMKQEVQRWGNVIKSAHITLQ
jgi:tripartite-type tricarboxylate transporter receptor subunit TctC